MSLLACLALTLSADTVLVYGDTVHPVSSAPITDGYVLIRDGDIVEVGAASTFVPTGHEQVLRAAVVTPGLVDARATVGLTGQLNIDADQDHIERSSPMQPQLRAIDAYNPQERLVEWVRDFGTTTVHTGHAPGALLSGRTFVVKTTGRTVDDAVVKRDAMLSCTLGPDGQSGDGAPGNRSKGVAMLRQKLLDASHWNRPAASEDAPTKKPDLEMQALVAVLNGDMPLLVHADRAQDIMNAIRLKREFKIDVIIDGGTEAYAVIDDLRDADVPVIVHPPMIRSYETRENASFTTAAVLADAGVPIALQTGFEGYVPKVRVLVFEAGQAAAHGLGFDRALKACTIDAATLLGVHDRVGSLESGKDADLALWDGDPFEWTTHCTHVVIDGAVLPSRDAMGN
ncbi:MAG: amidohydrolase family protein [Phycisphaerales bacterium]|nr:amidohydrolase family protein [Phycisphaerales bacterium]